MGLKVVPAFTKDGEDQGTRFGVNGGIVCFESDNTKNFSDAIMELQSPDTRREAQKVAAQSGVSDPRLEFAQAPYAVDAAGDPIRNPLQQKIAAYRIDVKVTGRLV